MAFSVTDVVEQLAEHVFRIRTLADEAAALPNTRAIVQRFVLPHEVGTSAVRNWAQLRRILNRVVQEIVEPGLSYWETKSAHELGNCLSFFKAIRVLDPKFVAVHGITDDDLDQLEQFNCFKPLTLRVEAMKRELPAYLRAVEDMKTVQYRSDILQWYPCHEDRIPAFADATEIAILCQPSSAAAERVLSILQHCIGKQQERALEDYIELMCMLVHNDPKHRSRMPQRTEPVLRVLTYAQFVTYLQTR